MQNSLSLIRRWVQIVGALCLSFSSARAVELLQNSSFDAGLAPWAVNPELSPWSPLTSGTIAMHPPGFGFAGDVVRQNLNVTDVAGKTVTVSFDIQKNFAPDGRTVAVYLDYVDNANTAHRVRVLDVDNATVASAPAWTPVTGNALLPAGARKITRIALAKSGLGEFYVDNIHASADAVTVGAVPVISGVSGTGAYGSAVTIVGSGFGATQGTVTIGGGSGVTVQTWTDTQITAALQEPARSGRVRVFADFVEANGEFDFSVTSPNFTIDLQSTEQTVLKGGTATFIVKVGFHNGFTSANGVGIIVPEAPAIPVFSPSPVFGSGGVLLSINTNNLAVGVYNFTVQTLEDASFARFAKFKLNVVQPASARFYLAGVEVTSVSRNTQGEVSGFGFDLRDAGGAVLPNDGVVLSSTNPSAMLAIPKTTNGLNRVFSVDDGTGNIRITAPNGFTADLPFTVTLPVTPKVYSVILSPQSAPNSNSVDVGFTATASDTITVNAEGGLPDVFANGDWTSNFTTYTSSFKVPVGQKLATYMFSGGAGGMQRFTPFTVTNDPATGAISGEIRAIARNAMPDASGTIEFYSTSSAAAPVFTRQIFEFLTTSYTAPSVIPGSYKVRFVPGFNMKPTWYPGADTHAAASTVTVAAGQTVPNIHFFPDSADLQITQPNGATVNAGGSAQFSVTASGGTGSYSYKWRKGDVELSDGAGVSGATSPTLTLSNIPIGDDGAQIDVIVTDSAMTSVTSQKVMLTVNVSIQNGTLAFSTAALSVDESAGNAQVTIQRTNGSDGAVSVRCQTVAGSASAGSDFTAVDQVVNFAAGETSKVVSIPIANDTTMEGDEDLTLTLSTPTGGAVLGTPATVILTINDNDDTKAPSVTISKPAANSRFTAPPVMLSGTARDNFEVANVFYRIGTGTWIPAQGTTTWSAELFNLLPGDVTVEVKAVDSSGNESPVATRTFTFVVNGPLIVSVDGNGKVTSGFLGTTQREFGKTYKITATPGGGQVFDGWTGTHSLSGNPLEFVMEPNLELIAHFIPNPFLAVKGTYSGLFSDSPPTRKNSGAAVITVATGGTFTAKFNIAEKDYTLKGQFDNDGHFTGDIIRKGLSPLNISLQLDVSGGTDHIGGTISDGTFTADISADRSVFNAKTNPAPQAGRYTLAIRFDTDHAGNPTSPQGQGFGTVNVSAAGKITFVGTLGDGTDVSQGATLSTDGTWPLYIEAYKVKGYITCVINFEDLVLSDFSGVADWIKPIQTSGAVYRQGFTESVSIVGSRFTAPARDVRILPFTAGVIILGAGNLTQEILKNCQLTEQNKVTIDTPSLDNMKMSIKTASGLFSGSFIHPVSGKRRTFEGACVQKLADGIGLFIDGDKTGAAYFLER